MRGAIAGVVLGLWPMAGMAQSCDEAETTVAMVDCLQQALTISDDGLNVSYAQAIEMLRTGGYEDPAGMIDGLKAAQRAWIAYRDLACASEAAMYEGGTMEGVAKLGCLVRLTDERVFGLQQFNTY